MPYHTQVGDAEQLGLGPIAQAVEALDFDEVFLISDQSKETTEDYIQWLKSRNSSRIHLHYEKLSGLTNFGENRRGQFKADQEQRLGVRL